jgi:hypothetical protein
MPLHDCFTKYIQLLSVLIWLFHFRGRRCRDRMVVGFTTTYAISAYHYQYCEFESVYDKGFTITFVRLVVFAGYSGFLHR